MDASLHMDAVLRPNRSLPKQGLYILLGAVIAVNLITGAFMLLALHATPIPFFLGLDVLAVLLAFRASYRQARQAERVQVTADEVRVLYEIGAPNGRTRGRTVWRSPTAFTRVELAGEDEDARVRLHLSGKSLSLARQLSPRERAAFGRALDAAVHQARAERYVS